jgi:nucleotide-binding universal stress UspA family protein
MSVRKVVRRLVVGTDFSEGADHALLRAVELAAEWRAGIVLAHAYEDLPLGDRPSLSVFLADQLRCAAAGCGAEARGVAVETVLRRGAPWEKLLNVAVDAGADLIVLGARGQRGNLQGGLLGSVTTRVVAMSCRAVLVIPHRREALS